ncbi:unnamed protein product [Ixodes pacificus]
MKKASPTPGGRVQGRLRAEHRDEGGIMNEPSHIARPGDGKRNTNQGVLRTRDNPDAVGTKSNRGKYGERRLRIETSLGYKGPAGDCNLRPFTIPQTNTRNSERNGTRDRGRDV